jgi:hypothetical protein
MAVVGVMVVVSPMVVVGPMVGPFLVVVVTGTGVWVGHNALDARPKSVGPTGGRLALRLP